MTAATQHLTAARLVTTTPALADVPPASSEALRGSPSSIVFDRSVVVSKRVCGRKAPELSDDTAELMLN